MRTSRIHHVLLTLAMALAPSLQTRAEGVLDYLPEDALGFALVNDLGATDAKVQRFAKMFSIDGMPAPLTFLKFATGLEKGLDRDGQLLLAFLPGETPISAPAPMLLLPVEDYAQFVAPIAGDETGEICRVRISGEEVLIAKTGKFALLMNLENRETLELLLSLEPSEVELLKPLNEWISKNDILVTLMPSGVDVLTEMGQQGLAAQRKQLENNDDPEIAEALEPAIQGVRMYENILGAAGAEVDSLSIGVSLDERNNLRVGKRVLLKKDGTLAGTPEVQPMDRAPLADYANTPLVGGGGGPLPAAWGEKLAEASTRMIKQMPQIYGLEDLEDADWNEVRDSWLKATTGLRSMSMVFLPGEVGDPVYSNWYSVIGVEDAKAYLDTYETSIVSWNRLMEKSTSDLKFKYEMEKGEIAGKPCLIMTADITKMVGDDNNVAMIKQMMEMMFGKDGVMKIYIVAIDEHRLVSGLADEAHVEQVIKSVLSGKESLVDDPLMKTTLSQLDPKAPWQGVISPQGCVSWFGRMLAVMMGQFGGGAPQIPEYPAGPPVGLSLRIADGMLEGDMVWPHETLEGLAQFIKEVEAAN